MALNRQERRAAAKQDRGRGKPLSTAQFARIEQAIGLVNDGKFEEAETLLDRVRRSDPGDPEAKHQLGMIYVRTGRTEAGIDLIRQAVEARPQESLYWNNLAAAYTAIERSQEAIDAARKALALDRRNFLAWQNLALGLKDLADYAAADEAFEQAAALGSLSPTSLGTWAECLDQLKRFADAERVARSALAIVPDDPAILTLLGWLLTERKDDAGAREIFRRSLKIKPEQFLAAFNYGILSLRANETEVGLRWLRRATSIESKSTVAWRVLAIELVKHGLTDEALPVAERSQRLSPEDLEMRRLVRKLKGESAPETAVDLNSIVIEYDEPMLIGPEANAALQPDDEEADAPLLDLQILNIGGDE